MKWEDGGWYGTWIVDWICSDDPWEMFDIWEPHYLEAHPEFDRDSVLSLVEIYSESMNSIFESPMGKVISLFLQVTKEMAFPWQLLKELTRKITNGRCRQLLEEFVRWKY